MSEWKKYVGDRLSREHQSGFVVIKPEAAPEPIDLFCRVCDHALRTKEDEQDWMLFQCCSWCAKKWAYPRREAWKSGWRPERSHVLEEERERPKLHATLNID